VSRDFGVKQRRQSHRGFEVNKGEARGYWGDERNERGGGGRWHVFEGKTGRKEVCGAEALMFLREMLGMLRDKMNGKKRGKSFGLA